MIVHTPDGDVKVTKTEKPTQKGAWIGLAAGAGAAVVFPFLLPAVSYAGMAGAGAGLGAWFGHLAHGTSRGEAKDIGAMLAPGKAALIVIGIDKDAEQIERAARARSSTRSSATSATGTRPSRRPSRRWSARRPRRSADPRRRGAAAAPARPGDDNGRLRRAGRVARSRRCPNGNSIPANGPSRRADGGLTPARLRRIETQWTPPAQRG